MQDTNLMSGRMMVVVPVAVVIIGSAVMSSGSPLSLSEQDKKEDILNLTLLKISDLDAEPRLKIFLITRYTFYGITQ
jgi:hypothetical protein